MPYAASTMSLEEERHVLSSLGKKRDVVKHSITRLVNTLRTLEAISDALGVVDQAKQLIAKLEGFDKDFRSIHYEIIVLFDEDSEDLEKEHELLDKHEDDVMAMLLHLQKISSPLVLRPWMMVTKKCYRANSLMWNAIFGAISGTDE